MTIPTPKEQLDQAIAWLLVLIAVSLAVALLLSSHGMTASELEDMMREAW